MKTVVKINPEEEYNSAKTQLEFLLRKTSAFDTEFSKIGNSVDNMKTVINVLMERLTPKPKPKKVPKKKKKKKKKPREDFNKLPSEKYPNLDIEEHVVEADETPLCSCCNQTMKPSGLFNTSEKLEVVPKRYYIQRNKRVVYKCGDCDSSLVNAPSVPSIAPTSNYGDSLIMDVALSKYCDLIPIERYCDIAFRQGVDKLPSNSMVELTHTLANFLKPVYEKIKLEAQQSKILLMDETPHRMLEGHEKKNWYLWGFFTNKSAYFEHHPTRSGDVPLQFLLAAKAKYIMTDAYSGYASALSKLAELGKVIIPLLCNAHSYRKFKDAAATWEEETAPYRELYGKIYALERDCENREDKKAAREKMIPLFEEIKEKSEESLKTAMPKSKFQEALEYFIKHYPKLTACLSNPDLPLDNNPSERQVRKPVIGRKTWLGTHSERGAETAAIHFSLVGSCDINSVNARVYYPFIVRRILEGKEIITPYEFSQGDFDSG